MGTVGFQNNIFRNMKVIFIVLRIGIPNLKPLEDCLKYTFQFNF